MVYCANCNTTYPSGKRFCRDCGGPLTEVVQPRTTDSEGSLRCPSCGKEIATGKKFCRHCGTTLPAQASREERSASCPTCGNPLKQEKNFCGRCGYQHASQTVQTSTASPVQANLPLAAQTAAAAISPSGLSPATQEQAHTPEVFTAAILA